MDRLELSCVYSAADSDFEKKLQIDTAPAAASGNCFRLPDRLWELGDPGDNRILLPAAVAALFPWYSFSRNWCQF